MIYALTGTPGTGKTTIAKALAEKEIQIIDVKELASEHGFFDSIDNKRNSVIIDIDSVNKFLSTKLNSTNTIIIEGHVAHLLDVIDQCIILRCHPKELRKRLTERKWPWKKIKENIEAELLDVILCEAVDRFKTEHIYEIDTSTISIETLKDESYRLVTGNDTKNFKKPGSIDWSELLFDSSIMEEKAHGA